MREKGVSSFWYHNIGAFVFVGEETTLSVSGSVYQPSDLKVKPGAKEIVRYVQSNGFIPIVVTNQPDFVNKDILLREYEKIISKFCEETDIPRRNIFACLHKKMIGLPCNCKKPKPDLFLMAKGVFDIDMKNSWVIGDSWKDLKAGLDAGIKNTIFLLIKKEEAKQVGNEADLKKMQDLKIKPTHIISNLKEIKKIV